MNILGATCWYSCPDNVTVRADVLDDRLRVAGWEKAVPSRRGPADSLRRSLSDLCTTFPHLTSAPHGDGWLVRGAFARDTRKVRKALLKIEIANGVLRRTFIAPDANYHPQASAALAWVSQRYNFYHVYHDTHKVRRCVQDVMALCGFPHIRPGCFFIPENTRAQDLLAGVKAVFDPDAFDRGEVRFTTLPIADAREARGELAGDILHNIEEYLERIRVALLRHGLGEGDPPHPETMRDWLTRMRSTINTVEYFQQHVLGDGISLPADLPDLIEQVSELRAGLLGKDPTHEMRVA